MNLLLTILLWLGYLALVILFKFAGSVGFLPAFGLALVWTLIIEGLRKLLVGKPKG
jgi:hypothetical protein